MKARVPVARGRVFPVGSPGLIMLTMEDAGHRRRGIGHSTNLVGRPSEWLASCAFNEAPVPLHIWGVREMNRSLFGMLDQAADLAEAGEAFFCYMMAMFGLDPEERSAAPSSIRLNNLVSFSSGRDIAGCFGDSILTARVPVSKILFFNSLLSSHPLKGEGEYLAIGGEFRVNVDYV